MMNEKQLLADAELWFTKKHGHSPKELGVEFIKIWHKPVPFKKLTTVVFAQSREQGDAFIKEQNLILRWIKNFWLVGFFPIGFIVSLFARKPELYLAFTLPVLFCLTFYCYYQSRKCKHWEKIHQWNVDVYYPPNI